MKIALIADIHGNSVALDAVLADITASGGADAYWILGDIVAFGHDPVGVLERLLELPGLICIRGNTDRYVTTGDRPPPTFDQAAASPDLIPVVAEVAGTLGWTLGSLTTAGWMPWLIDLPLEVKPELPGGQAVLLVHAAPGTDDGAGIAPHTEDDEVDTLLSQVEEELVCVGHTHYCINRRFKRWHIVNPGSTGLPRPEDPRASYVLLTAHEHGYQIEHRYVDFDRERVAQTVRAIHHPGAAYIIRHLTPGD